MPINLNQNKNLRTENPRVAGSIPALATIKINNLPFVE